MIKAAFKQGFMVLCAIYVVLPIMVVCLSALNGGRSMLFPPEDPTLGRFVDFFVNEPVWLNSLENSVVIALSAATLAILITWPVAYDQWKKDSTFSRILASLAGLPGVASVWLNEELTYYNDGSRQITGVDRLRTDATVVREHTDASRPPTHPNCTPPQRRNLLVLAEQTAALPEHTSPTLQHTPPRHMPQTRSQTKADKVDARVAVALTHALVVDAIKGTRVHVLPVFLHGR